MRKLLKQLQTYHPYQLGSGKKAFIRHLKAIKKSENENKGLFYQKPKSLKPYVVAPKADPISDEFKNVIKNI